MVWAAMVLAALALPPTATAKRSSTPVRSFGSAYSPVVTDGARYVVFKSAPGVLSIRDDRAGGTRTVQVESDCNPVAGGSAAVLLSCSNGSYLILDAASGALGPLPGAGSSWQPGCAGFAAIGRYWVGGIDCISGPNTIYVNRTTGGAVHPDLPDEIGGAPRDLDTTGLRTLGPTQTDPFASGAEGSFVLRERGRDKLQDHPDLVVFRHKALYATVDRCRPTCASPTFGSGDVTWGRGRTGYGFQVRHRKRSHWRLPGSITTVSGQGINGIYHTGAHVFFTTGSPQSGGAPYRIYEASWR
jgi:hypothetical protein